jgi:hypothetical protein
MMGNRTPNLGIPIPYPRSANVDELFDWERFLHDAFMVVDRADILFTSRIRVAGQRPLADLLSELGDDGGGILYFPAGVYEVSGTLTVPANVRLLGNNAVLRPSASFYNSGDYPMFLVAGDGVVFEGLTFEGHTSNSDVRVSAVATNGYETTIVRCRFLRMGYTAVDHRSTARNGVLRIRDSRFENCWGDCVLMNLSLDADSVVFTHPSTSISTVAAYRGYGVGIKASTQAGQTLRMVLRNVEFDRLLRTAILLTANPSHPAYEVRINGVKVREIGLTRFSNPSGEASAISNDESLYGALIYVKSTSATEEDIGTVHITDFDVDEPYGFVVRFPVNNEKRHYLSKGRYKHGASGWSGSNPFNPISLRLARAFVSDVEGNAFKRHFTKQSDAYGSYDTVFQNCRFTGVADFGGTASDNIWYINCTFSGTAPAPTGGWFIGCYGASQYQGDKVIASDGGHISTSSIHLGTFQTGMCFKTTANYGLRPQIKANGRLTEVSIRQSVLIPITAFLLADGEDVLTIQDTRVRPPFYTLVAGFLDDSSRPSNLQYRRLITTLPLPRNFFVPSTSDSAFSLKLRVSFSFSGGRSDLVPIRIRIRWIRHGETSPTTNTLFGFAPLTTTSITANSIYNAEFTLSPANLPSSATNGGALFIEIARQYVSSESEVVWVHSVELVYPALLEA